MTEIIIDFSECKNGMDLHNVLKETLGFPDFYGANLDALWDSITGFIQLPEKIIFSGVKNLKTELYEYIKLIINIFQRAKIMYYNDLIITIED